MPRPCTICTHSEREAINRALVSGESYRKVAKQFEASEPAMYRHVQHLPAGMESVRPRPTNEDEDLVGYLRSIATEAKRLAQVAEDSGQLSAAIAALREQGRVVQIILQAAEGRAARLAERPIAQQLATMSVSDTMRRLDEAIASLTRERDRLRSALPEPRL